MVEEDEHLIPTKSPNGMWKIELLAIQVQLLAFTWQNCLELIGEGAKGKYLAPLNNQCSGQNKLVSVASSCSRRRKISDFKTRADGALKSGKTVHLVETTQTMVWADGALQPW